MQRDSIVFARRHRRDRFTVRPRLALVLAAALSFGAVAFVAWTPPVSAATVGVTVEKTAPESVLVGAPITYSVKAANPSDAGDSDFRYNLTVRDVLPAGVAYVSTTAPAGLAGPQQIAELDAVGDPTGRTILIWSNVADLPDASDVTVTYTAQPSASAYPVGATVTNDATAYVSTDERRLAKFTAAGELVPDPLITGASDQATTTISALQLEKDEPSSEHELDRGVHDRPTVYRLKVINNGEMATNDVTVVDYLPAGLEFLGCGGIDNSAAGFEEYPGSGRLDSTPVIASCLTPTSVTTVDSGLPAGYPAGVYTRVEWTVPDLAASDTFTIRYAAGVPLRSNVMPTGPFSATANLDNNTAPGASTRETGTEPSLTNRAVATGLYQGLDVNGQTGISVTAKDEVTVTAEDLAVAKSIANAGSFAQGGDVQYDLRVRSSEYTDGSDIVLVDTLPDGLCPSDAPSSTYTPAALTEASSGQCAPAGTGNAAIDEVDFVGGLFVVTFAPFDLSAADASTTVSFTARMRDTYNGGTEETSAGDSYRNTVALTGTTTPISTTPSGGTGESGTQVVEDVSAATLTSDAPTLDKRVLRNTPATHSCNDSTWSADPTTGNWRDSQADAGDTPFTVGSRVCFQVRVVFPTNTSTRLPVVTDYLPDNLTYEAGTFELVPGVNTAAFTPDQSAIDTAFATGSASFRPGTTQAGSRYVEKGQVFAFRFSAVVKTNTKAVVDVQGNLAKLRWTDRAGRVSALRDLADFRVPPIPPVTIDKQVAKAPYTSFAASRQVVEDETVRYRLAVTNAGTGADVSAIAVWDVLPASADCGDVSAVSDGGACTDPGDSGHPTFTDRATRSAVRWVLPADVAAGDSTSVTYDLTVPAGTGVSATPTNTASVQSYATPTNLGGVSAIHFPADNVDTTVDPADEDAPAATDSAAVSLPAVGLTKTSTTSVDEAGNGANEAVPGELVTYAIRATVPAHTTVYGGVLTDPMPTDLTFVSATAGWSATGADPAVGALPPGTTLNPATGTLTLPATVANTTGDDQVFQVDVVARVRPGQVATLTRTNTARFTSTTTAGGSDTVPDVTATSDVALIHPSATLTKALTATAGNSATPSAGEEREYVLTAGNASGRPTLYDAQVIDCVPAGLTVTTLPAAATSTASVGGDACDSVPGTGTTITWNAGTIATGATKTLTYTVRVSLTAAGGQAYTNVATVTGSSLADGGNTVADEQVVTATDTKTLTVPAAGITKTILDNTLTIGERATYTVTATFPANATFFNAAISDALPVGLDPASVQTSAVTCTDADGACALPSPGTAMTPDGQTVGFFFGDLTASTKTRTVAVTLTAKVLDNCTTLGTLACNTRGQTPSNAAAVRWDLTAKTPPTVAGSGEDRLITSSPVIYTVQEPRTAITKSVSDTTPDPGQTFTYSVTASNPGGSNRSDAHNVAVSDVVPPGVDVDVPSVVAAGGTYFAPIRTIVWSVPLLAVSPGTPTSKTFTYQATLAASGTINGTGLTNTATITSFESLATGGRSYVGPAASAIVTPQLPHIKVAKRVVGSNVSYVGDPQNFEIVVTSDGSSPARLIDVSDVLPKNWLIDGASAMVTVGAGVSTPLPPTVTTASGQQTARWLDLAPGGLAPGATIVISYTATPQAAALIDPGAGSTAAHTNTVSIVAEDATGAMASGAGSYAGGPATATARIHSADLKVTKTAIGTPVAGSSFSWKIAVHNNGGDPAVGPIVVTDSVPTGVSSFSLSGSGWSCTSTTTVWTCTRSAALASGADANDITATGTIDSDITSGTALVNEATVDGRTYDPQSGNDSDDVSVGITTLADLRIVKDLTGSITAGQDATWTLDVTNLGPSTSRGPITVKDQLPAGATFVSATGNGWTCSETGGEVTCTRSADLPAVGQTAAGQITVVATISAAQTGGVTNTATVVGTTPEPLTPTAVGNSADEVTGTPTRTADLFIQKTLKGTDPAVPGDPATYVLDVSNNGPSTATNVTITDTLPSYMTFVSGGNGDWDCSAAGQVVTCDLDGSLAVGGTNATSVEITVDVASDHTGPIVNSATVVATEDPTGSTDDDSNDPSLISDLEVTKTHTGDATAGESITYGVMVTNDGPSDTAGPIVVEDTVPTGMTYDSVSGAGWTCAVAAGTVTCTHAGGLVDQAASSFDLTFDVADTAGPASVVNNVSVDGPNADPTIGDNTDADDTDIVDDANLSIVKKAVDPTVHSGDAVSWTIDVTNDGPSTADSISVSDQLPAGLTDVTATGTGWTCTTAPFVCSRASLAPGAAPTITVEATVSSGVPGGTVLTNTATVSTVTPGDALGDNEDDADVTTTTSADMTLVKTHTGTPVAGSTFTFELTATNDGPSDAQGPITIDDHLPVGMTFRSANDAWSCVASAASNSGQDVFCTLVAGGPVAAGDSAPTLAMLVDVASDQSGVVLVNTAEVDAATTDPDTDNNTDTDTVTPTDEVDLSITKSHTGPVEVGERLTFTIGVHNDGPSEARDVVVTDTLPTGLTLVSAAGTGWTCVTGTCTLTDPLAVAADASPITVVADVTPAAYPDVTNVVGVTTSSDDTDDSNDEARDRVVVPPKVDLGIVKKLDGTLRVGANGTYTLTVGNQGPTADPGVVTVTDQLPAGLTYVAAKATGWECGAVQQLVTCTRTGSFAVDASEAIVLTVGVGAAAYPSVVNTAQVASPAVDTDPSDNASSVPSVVAGSSLLSIDKSLDEQDGRQAVWSIKVTNKGPTVTTAPIVVTDDLPKTLSFVSATGDGWTCSEAARVVTCTYAGPLAVGATATISVTTKIIVDDGSTVTNVASVDGGNSVDDGSGSNDPGEGQTVSDDATVTAPGVDSDGLIPDTGGVALWLLLAGLALVAAGGVLVTRRRPSGGKHR